MSEKSVKGRTLIQNIITGARLPEPKLATKASLAKQSLAKRLTNHLQWQPPKWSPCFGPNLFDDPSLHGIENLVVELNKPSALLQMPPYLHRRSVRQRSKGTERIQWGSMCALITSHEHRSMFQSTGDHVGNVCDSPSDMAGCAFSG